MVSELVEIESIGIPTNSKGKVQLVRLGQRRRVILVTLGSGNAKGPEGINLIVNELLLKVRDIPER